MKKKEEEGKVVTEESKSAEDIYPDLAYVTPALELIKDIRPDLVKAVGELTDWKRAQIGKEVKAYLPTTHGDFYAPARILSKMRRWPVDCTREVIGLLYGGINPTRVHDVVIDELEMLPMAVSEAAAVRAASEHISRAYQADPERAYRWIGWYHTHPTFAPNPSSIDMAMIDRHGPDKDGDGRSWFLTVIGGMESGSVKLNVFFNLFKPCRFDIAVPGGIRPLEERHLSIETAIERAMNSPVSSYGYYGTGYRGGNWDDGDYDDAFYRRSRVPNVSYGYSRDGIYGGCEHSGSRAGVHDDPPASSVVHLGKKRKGVLVTDED